MIQVNDIHELAKELNTTVKSDGKSDHIHLFVQGFFIEYDSRGSLHIEDMYHCGVSPQQAYNIIKAMIDNLL